MIMTDPKSATSETSRFVTRTVRGLITSERTCALLPTSLAPSLTTLWLPAMASCWRNAIIVFSPASVSSMSPFRSASRSWRRANAGPATFASSHTSPIIRGIAMQATTASVTLRRNMAARVITSMKRPISIVPRGCWKNAVITSMSFVTLLISSPIGCLSKNRRERVCICSKRSCLIWNKAFWVTPARNRYPK